MKIYIVMYGKDVNTGRLITTAQESYYDWETIWKIDRVFTSLEDAQSRMAEMKSFKNDNIRYKIEEQIVDSAPVAQRQRRAI